ncbi:hypothetical protein D3C71_1689140 [compost metagenome]
MYLGKRGKKLKAALYMVRRQIEWECYISLDIKTDLQWWTLRSESDAENLLLLALEIPLGRATSLRDGMEFSTDMDSYKAAEWIACLERIETRVRRRGKEGRGRQVLSMGKGRDGEDGRA